MVDWNRLGGTVILDSNNVKSADQYVLYQIYIEISEK